MRNNSAGKVTQLWNAGAQIRGQEMGGRVTAAVERGRSIYRKPLRKLNLTHKHRFLASKFRMMR